MLKQRRLLSFSFSVVALGAAFTASSLISSMGLAIPEKNPFSRQPTIKEALMVEYDFKQGDRALVGKVLLQPGDAEWKTLGDSKGMKLQARARLVEPEIAQIETRTLPVDPKSSSKPSSRVQPTSSATLLVRLGQQGKITVGKTTGENSVSPKPGQPDTDLAVTIRKVRYSL